KPSLAKCGVIGKPNYDFFNPSILSFGKDDYTVVSLSRSGNSSTPSDHTNDLCGNIGAYAALLREAPDQCQIYPLQSGLATHYIQRGPQRCADYSTICRDPTSPRTAWVFNHFVTHGGGEDKSLNRCVIARIDLPPP